MITSSMITLSADDGGSQINNSDVHVNASIYYDGIAKSVCSMILSDLGQSNENNIFASPQRTVEFMTKSNELPTDGQGGSSNHNSTLWGFLGETQNASQSSAPTDITTFFDWAGAGVPHVEPTTFYVQYLCQVSKLRAFSSLFVSVVVADFVFLRVVWMLFVWITAYFLERRHPNARYCDGCTRAIALGQLDTDAEARPDAENAADHGACCSSTTTSEPLLTWSEGISTGSSTTRVDAESPLAGSNTVSEHLDPDTRKGSHTNSYFSISDV